jgi:hypothetical protein
VNVTDSTLGWRDLDQRAVVYARTELTKGKALARACLSVVPDCQPRAHLPGDTPTERVYNFTEGGVNRGLPRGDALPADLLWAFLRQDDPGWQRVILFEDRYARPTDPFIAEGRSETPVAFLGDEVYQLITPERAGNSLALPVAEFPIIGVVSRLAGSPSALRDRGGLPEKVIQELADNSLAVLVGAWDAENYPVALHVRQTPVPEQPTQRLTVFSPPFDLALAAAPPAPTRRRWPRGRLQRVAGGLGRLGRVAMWAPDLRHRISSQRA